MTIEKVSQDEMLTQFKERYAKLVEENQKMAAQIKENEIQALKLQGAIETLEYYSAQEETASHPPDESEAE
jgi:Ni,Fe-hydrogenase III component G